MKKISLLLIGLLFGILIYAQSAHFVYIQSDPAAPFYLKINGDTRQSSSSGYLILSKLEETKYSFSIGLTDKKFAEQNFEITIGAEDKGYLFKYDSAKVWILEDMRTKTKIFADSTFLNTTTLVSAKDSTTPQSQVTVNAEKMFSDSTTQKTVNSEKKSVAPFSQQSGSADKESFASLLAKASGDDELLVSPFITTSPLKKEKIDYSSVVSKSAESSTSEGFGLQFIDKYKSGSLDTIKILIPNPQVLIDAQKIARKLTTVSPDSSSHCKAIATDDNFKALLAKLNQEKNDFIKIDIAKKEFSNYCFAAEQIKILSSTIANSDNKYMFLLDAYQAVYNRTAFREMINQLGDAEITERFKLLLN